VGLERSLGQQRNRRRKLSFTSREVKGPAPQRPVLYYFRKIPRRRRQRSPEGSWVPHPFAFFAKG
jgi:hypothetical protein